MAGRIARAGAAVALVLLAAVIAFQVALILGAPWGQWTQGGGQDGPLDATGRVFAGVSALVLGAFGFGIAGRMGWGPLARRRRLSAVLTWTAVGYGFVAVLLNGATPSARERAVWLPVSVVLLAAVLTAALGSRRSQEPSADPR